MRWQQLLLREIPRDPISIGVISAVAGLAGSAVSAAGAMAQGQAAKQAADYNAAMAERQAVLAKNSALAEEQAVRAKGDRQRGAAAAAIGASGITAEGTPLDVLAETVSMNELDALSVRWQGDNQATNLKSQAELTRMQGKSAMQAARYGAASALIGGVYSVGSSYSKGGFGNPLKLNG